MQTIGKYQVEKVLGRGGMGTVYQALDPVIHRRVALKTMIPDLVEAPDLRARFLREAQAAGGLRHRNIVTVYDLGEDKGQPYIAMEFIEGTDLERIIQNREPYSIEWKLDVIRQVCEGLGYAHRSGIVHRDVKPANIRVTPEGEVKIMDFGIAHLQSSTMTKSGLVLGTVHYMAPEQVEGHKVDHRADIFSVGAIAYELIAYKRPWDGDSLTSVMFKIMREPPDLGSLPASAYSPGLEAIVSKALAKSVHERYQSLEEMRDELERLVRDTAARLLKSGAPGSAEGSASARLASLLEEVRVRIALGESEDALAAAREAVALAPEDGRAKAALREAESEGLRRRVEREMSDIRAEMERAQAEGQLQKALSLCRRLLELDPDDEGLVRRSQAIEAAIRDREVEQLSSMALSYAADGDMDLAQKIAAKIGRLAPENPRAAQLKKYVEEEAARRAAEALTATAQEHLAHGNLEEARAAAEEALAAQPTHAVAREIRDRASAVLAVRSRGHAERPPSEAGETAAETVRMPVLAPETAARAVAVHRPAGVPAAEPTPASVAAATPPPIAAPVPPVAVTPAPVAVAPPPVAVSPVTPRPVTATPPPLTPTPVPVPSPTPPPGLDTATLSPLPEGPPSHPEAAALLETARRHLKERLPQKAVPLLEQALALEPGHPAIQRLVELARLDARRAEAASLTASALNHFMQSNHAKARKAVEKALALEPENKKAKELLKILSTLS